MSNWVLAIIAIAAIVSPVFVTMTNNRHAERLNDANNRFKHDQQVMSYEARTREQRVELLASFTGAINNLLTTYGDENRPIVNETAPKLMQFLDDDKRNKIIELLDITNKFGSFTEGEELLKAMDTRRKFNESLPEWLDYIEQLPVRKLPEAPTTYKAFPNPFDQIRSGKSKR